MNIHYSLSDLLDSDILKGYRVLGRTYPYDRIFIREVSVQEIPIDYDIVAEGELVLSTAAGCGNQGPALVRFVNQIADTRAAALCLTFQDPSFIVPGDVIAAAQERSLPLFQIPWELKFRDVIATVTRQIYEKKTSLFSGLQAELFNACFELASLDKAVQLISDTMDTGAAVFTSKGLLLAASRDFPGHEAGTATFTETDISDADELPCTGFPIIANNSRVGTLWLTGTPGSFYGTDIHNTEEEIISRHICFPLSLWYNRRMIEDLTNQRLKNDFIWDLANHNYVSYEEMLQQGAHLKFDLNLPYTCILIRSVSSNTCEAEQYTSETAATANRMAELLVKCSQRRLMYATASNRLEFIVFLENAGHQAAQSVERYLSAVEKEFLASFPAYRPYFGISEINMRKPDFHRLYANAALALQYCLNAEKMPSGFAASGQGRPQDKGTGTGRYYFTYLDTREAQIVSVLSTSGELRKAASEVIGALRNYGRPKEFPQKSSQKPEDAGIDLVGTLSTFIRSNHSISRTARALHIHRQSLLYRMEKIEEITEMSLSSHQDLFLLEIYCRVLSVY